MTDQPRGTRYRTEPVSFTRRGGRLSERQQNAWDAVSATYVAKALTNGPATSTAGGSPS